MNKKTALVISGGGAMGAFGGGISEHLIINQGKEYDILIGTSTGSLLIPHLSVGNLSTLKTAYTTVSQDDIFKINPFKIEENKHGTVKTKLHYWNILRNQLKGSTSFGDSSNLRDLLSKYMTQENYDSIKSSGKEVIACVTNMTLGQVEYKSIKDYGREDFIDWMYASSCAYPFMSLVKKDGYEYCDGGLIDQAPIQEAILRGATEIDAIILREEGEKLHPELIRNVFGGITRIVDIMVANIGKCNVDIGRLVAKNKEIKLNLYFTPRKLTNNFLIFNKEVMIGWWSEGYEMAKQNHHKTYELKNRRKPKLLFDGTKDTED